LAEALGAVPMPEHLGWPAPAERDVFHAFVLHHLLWRFNQAASRPARAPMRVALTKAIEQLVTGFAAARLAPQG
jgi:hypothetical protein